MTMGERKDKSLLHSNGGIPDGLLSGELVPRGARRAGKGGD